MSTQRYHIGKNGPAPCNAHPERPNGRACRFGEDRHGSQAEMIELWESEQEADHGSFLGGVSRASAANSHERSRMQKMLSDPLRYYSVSEDGFEYSQEDVSVALNLGSLPLSNFAVGRVKDRDLSWKAGGTTSVQRYELMDGSIGYFKSFQENSRYDEHEFRSFGTSTLGAAINEVNARRMAQLLGSSYEKLIPETVLREIDGEIGSFQREVPESSEMPPNFHRSAELREDYRKAAIFDFVIGNLDRHDANFLYSDVAESDGSTSKRIRLIDNAYSFPAPSDKPVVNDSMFSDNDGTDGDFELDESGEEVEFEGYFMENDEFKLTPEELQELKRARRGVRGWMRQGTIAQERGQAVVNRIDRLTTEGRMLSLRDHIDELNRTIRTPSSS